MGSTKEVSANGISLSSNNIYNILTSYREKVKVSVSKTNLTFQGQGLMNTIIARDDTAGNTNDTYSSASVAVDGYGFRAYNISFRV